VNDQGRGASIHKKLRDRVHRVLRIEISEKVGAHNKFEEDIQLCRGVLITEQLASRNVWNNGCQEQTGICPTGARFTKWVSAETVSHLIFQFQIAAVQNIQIWVVF
jgi:hypothetical protein